MKYFPEVIGQNLNSQKATFPEFFTHKWNVVVTGFLMEHQQAMESWMPVVNRWESIVPGLQYLEMPILPSFDFTSRISIHLSMKWYIHDLLRRERTYTVFTDVPRFLRETGTPSQVRNRTFLIDDKGRILINAPGPAAENLIELFERKMGLQTSEIWEPHHHRH